MRVGIVKLPHRMTFRLTSALVVVAGLLAVAAESASAEKVKVMRLECHTNQFRTTVTTGGNPLSIWVWIRRNSNGRLYLSGAGSNKTGWGRDSKALLKLSRFSQDFNRKQGYYRVRYVLQSRAGGPPAGPMHTIELGIKPGGKSFGLNCPVAAKPWDKDNPSEPGVSWVNTEWWPQNALVDPDDIVK